MSNIFNESFVIAVCFIAFILLVYRPIKKVIVGALDKRIAEIKHNLDETKKLRSETQELLSKMESEIEVFEKKKEQIINNAKKTIKEDLKLKNQEMELLFARMEKSAKQNFEYKTGKATEDMKKEFVQKVMELVKTYLQETDNNNLSSKETLELIDKWKIS